MIVFSHDDRLASLIRETGIDARLLEVVREAGSRVSVRDNVNPALRTVNDVFALLKDDNLSDEVKRRTAPGLFRIAVESAAKQSFYTQRSVLGRSRAEAEADWLAAKRTTSRVSLAVYGDSSADLTSWRQAKPARAATTRICNAGAHGADHPVTIEDARDLERTVHEVLTLR